MRRSLPLLAVVAALAFAARVCGEDAPAPAVPPGPGPAASEGAAPGTAPRVEFDREAHDFGVATQEQELRTTFTIRNTGTAPLTVLDVRSDCGCGAATVGDREIAPGASAEVAVTMRTLSLAGVLNKRILLRTNDPVNPRSELKLRVDISAGIVLVPARFFFGDVVAGTAPSTTLRAQWKEGVGKPFHVTGVEAPGLDLAFETKPFEEGPWRGFEVTATFKSPPKVGTIGTSALLRTDDPTYPRFVVGVQAYVSGKVWVDRRTVNLGMVPAGKGRQTAVICRPFGKDVDLGEVKATARKGVVTVRAVPSGKDWVVTIDLPPEAPGGPVEDVIEIRSSIPGEPVTEVAITGFVSGGAKPK